MIWLKTDKKNQGVTSTTWQDTTNLKSGVKRILILGKTLKFLIFIFEFKMNAQN